MSDPTDANGDRGNNSIYPIDRTGFLTIFYTLMLTWTVTLLVLAQQWNWEDRAFPMLAGVSVCVLIVYKLAKIQLDVTTPLTTESSTIMEETGSEAGNHPTQVRQHYELLMVGWVIGLPVALYYLGFALVIPSYLFTFVWALTRNLKRSVLITVGGTLFFYILFIIILDVPVWEGVLDIPIEVPTP